MKHIIYTLLFPIFIFAQENVSISGISSKKLIFSFQCGAKMYSGNKFLDNTTFSREGVFGSFNFFTQRKNITSKLSFSLSNAFAKEIDLSILETDVDFVTKIPNILACNINYSIAINKEINNFLDHGVSFKFRVFPLFYQKGPLFNDAKHSLGGLISSEENGSLPDLEKASQISYNINYGINDLTSFSLLIFVNSDWSIHDFENFPLYPGIAVKLEKILNQDVQPPWMKVFNK